MAAAAPFAIPLIGGLFSSLLSPKPPKVVEPPEERRSGPTVDDAAVRRAKLRSQSALRSRSGRASTILTDDDETLG